MSTAGEIRVECKAEGIPKPDIKWKSETGEIFHGEILTITHKNLQSKLLECIADNGIGRPLRKVIQVLINGMLICLIRSLNKVTKLVTRKSLSYLANIAKCGAKGSIKFQLT